MAKNSRDDWDTTAANNTDIGGINIDENCAAANINNAIREMMAQLATIDGRLLNVQVFSTAESGTYTPTSGTAKAYAHVVGGGGPGGGADSDTNGAQIGCGGGGGAGAEAWVWFDVTEATYSYTVAATEAGGTDTADGSNGNTSSLTGTNLTITCPGGKAGSRQVDTDQHAAEGGDVSNAPTVSGTDVFAYTATRGSAGFPGLGIPAAAFASGGSVAFGGNGAKSSIGHGGLGSVKHANGSVQAGYSGTQGSGGSGAVTVGSAAARSGGDGGAGHIVIVEYSE
jgi:hypothetical protein